MRARLSLVPAVFANYATVAWTALLGLVSVPICIRLLGPNGWAVVAAAVTLQNAAFLLDAGLSQIVPRVLASGSTDADWRRNTFLVYSRLYAIVAAIGAFLLAVGAPMLVGQWFSVQGAQREQLEWAIRLMSIQFGFQFANSLHYAFWVGTDRQVTGSYRQCIFATVRQLGALACIQFISATPLMYIGVSVVVAIIEWCFCRRWILIELPASSVEAPALGPAVLAAVRGAASLSFGVVVGMLVSQYDRMLMSKTQELTAYGTYSVAVNIGLAFLQLQYPMVRAFYPRVVKEVSGGLRKFRASAELLFLLSTCFAIPCLVASAYSFDLLRFWTGDDEMAHSGRPVLSLLLKAAALNCIYNVIYQRIVASGLGRAVIFINVIVMASLVALTLGAENITLETGGWMWICSSTVQLACGLGWLIYILRKNKNRDVLR